MLTRPPIDWTRPVQWMNGDPAEAERVNGFILITIGERYPREIDAIMQRKHFQDSIVVHEDTGVPAVGLGEYAPEAWIENVERPINPMEALIGAFG